jgi:hemoglobin
MVKRASVDPNVNFSRIGSDRPWHASPANVAALKRSITLYLSHACGGPVRYEGRTMKAAHAGLAISNSEFDALAAHLIAALDKAGVGQREKDELLAIVGATRQDIVERK